MSILVTGGAGYIGSHTVLSLLERDREVIVVDNFSNSSRESLRRIEILTNKCIKLYECDITDEDSMRKIFIENDISSVINFAGLKSVSQSIKDPLGYYINNLSGTFIVLKLMQEYGVNNFIFSSSATVYGNPENIPLNELCHVGNTTNPYGTSKYFVENVLKDISKANPYLSITILRYFNPVGAHESGIIGEDPNGIPSNLVPYISQVAIGKLEKLSIYGGDYPTVDGTGVRDYIHVMDLAEGHLQALNKQKQGLSVYNLGTGKGYSVLEIIKAFETVSGRKIPYEIVARRQGDIAECWADVSSAAEKLDWHTTRDLNNMITDCWNWQQKNPKGYNV